MFSVQHAFIQKLNKCNLMKITLLVSDYMSLHKNYNFRIRDVGPYRVITFY